MNKSNILLVFLLVGCLLGASGCTDSGDSEPEVPPSPDVPTVPEASGSVPADIRNETVDILSEDQAYPAYTAAPASEGSYPAVVLIHSFNGFQPGYKEMVDRMAADGYVVVAPQWQNYSQSPPDAEVESLVRSSITYLQGRDDVNPEKLGLTGFCAGGRYTMLFLPQVAEFKSGVAWYGFPYAGDSETQPDKPADLAGQLDSPMLMIHGTRDQPSNISDIYRYAGELDAADKYFELKVYQGEPHGFMITEDGELSESFVALDAYGEMIEFFNRTLV
ncbi:dienelactone hydrolase family protein [Methanosarcina sp. KYL-1]|uniref:dienelactone hydrolase family protein n=1 Tax=Methanosarcina sp. KYL-1 TaxID=2602068 RepID=UPI0021014CC9|nr:dienelactone hydrolase family protein [Methanosarcina sp. KYL-1]